MANMNVNTYADSADLFADTRAYPTVVFGGYSGLGYQDEAKLKDQLRAHIKESYDHYGCSQSLPLIIVAGATADGIGIVYKVAKDLLVEEGLSIMTVGIVSEAGRKYGTADEVDRVLFVPDPDKTWKVIENGRSLMVDAVGKRNDKPYGHLAYFGGGGVSESEIQEAKEQGLPVLIVGHEPSKNGVAKKLKKDLSAVTEPDIDRLNPLRDWKNGYHLADGRVVDTLAEANPLSSIAAAAAVITGQTNTESKRGLLKRLLHRIGFNR